MGVLPYAPANINQERIPWNYQKQVLNSLRRQADGIVQAVIEAGADFAVYIGRETL